VSIRFACPACGKVLIVRDQCAGGSGKCPHCGGGFSVPSRSTHGAEPPRPARAARTRPPSPAPDSSHRRATLGVVALTAIAIGMVVGAVVTRLAWPRTVPGPPSGESPPVDGGSIHAVAWRQVQRKLDRGAVIHGYEVGPAGDDAVSVGTWTWWYADGQPWRIELYDAEGQLHGPCADLWENGARKEHVNYIHGVPTQRVEFDEAGRCRRVARYDDRAKLHGNIEWWDPHGKQRVERYDHGTREERLYTRPDPRRLTTKNPQFDALVDLADPLFQESRNEIHSYAVEKFVVSLATEGIPVDPVAVMQGLNKIGKGAKRKLWFQDVCWEYIVQRRQNRLGHEEALAVVRRTYAAGDGG